MCDTPIPPYLPDGRAAPPVASRHMRFLNRMRHEIDDYDGYCKRQLSRKAVLARLLKDYLPECAPFTVDEIERCSLSSLPHDTASSYSHSNDSMEELVSGLATDASDIGAGTSKLDLLFRIQPPSTEDSAAVMVNIEPQDSWRLPYPLMARSAFYCARILSQQKGIEFLNSDYGRLKKVYSIWILTSPPKALRGTITCTRLGWKETVGTAAKSIERLFGTFDYFNTVVVGLNGYDRDCSESSIPLLDAVLSKTMETEERLRIIRDGYGISDSGIEREVHRMGSLGMQMVLEALQEGENKGLKKGLSQGRASSLLDSISSLMRTLGLSREQAMDALEVPKADRPRYNALLDGRSD